MQIIDFCTDDNMMETTEHGSFSFPMAIYHTVLSRNTLGYANWHWHSEIQFCLVTVGQVLFFVNEKQHFLHTGEGIFINSSCLHMAKPVGDPNSSYICLDANPKLLSSFPGSVFEGTYVTPFLNAPSMSDCCLQEHIPWQSEILAHIWESFTIFEEKKFGYEFELVALLARMWLLLLRRHLNGSQPAQPHSQKDMTSVQKILSYLNRNYGEHITIDLVSKAVSFSGSECCRIFKRVTGETIFSYLQAYRVSKAAELLENTDMPISQIAYETGFCSTSYFIKIFQRIVGCTPLKYRKNNLKNTAVNRLLILP